MTAALAPPLGAEPWPVKQFEILNVKPDGVGFPNIGTNIIAEDMKPELAALVQAIFNTENPPHGLVTVPLERSTKLEMENFLTEVASLYERWGFAGPDLRPIVEDENGRDAFRVYIVNGLPSSRAGRYKACVFENIAVNAEDILSGGQLTDFGAFVLAHELFHAVFAGTNFVNCWQPFDRPGLWISEGLADAVGADAVRIIRNPEPDFNVFDLWGLRAYHRTLTVPLGRFDHDRKIERDQYATASFWRYLAETHALGQPAGSVYLGSDYGFLPGMLNQGTSDNDCLSSDALCNSELRWADFHVRRIFGEPLRDIYARFMQAYVQYPEDRNNIEVRQWYKRSFGSACTVMVLRGTPDPEFGGLLSFIERLPVGKIERNAAKCYRFVAVGFEEGLRMRVRVYDPTGRLPIQSLSAVVGRHPSSVPKPVISTEEGGGPAQSIAWTFGVEIDRPRELVLTNMADDPAATIPLDGLLLEITALEDVASLGSSEPAQVFGAVPIELDQFPMKGVVPTLTPQLVQAGLSNPCSLRLMMTNSETGDGVEVNFDDEAPIRPGTYNIAHLEGGHFKGSEEHAGKAVVVFRLGKGNSLSQGDAQVYGGQTGTLTIDAFTHDLLSGSLTVLGERAPDGKWEGEIWRDYPDELNAVAATANFSIVPELPRGTASTLSIGDCLDPVPEKRVRKNKAKNQKKEKRKESEEDETSESSDPEDDAVIPGDSAQESASAAPYADDPVSPADDQSEVLSIECRPLFFDRSVPYSGGNLPFGFDHPYGWLAEGSGLKSRIAPPAYSAGGIEIMARPLNSREVAQAMALNQAMFPQIASLDLEGQHVPVYGGQIGDTLNTQFVLPMPDGHLAVEVLFKGRRGCARELISDVRALFLDTLRLN